MAALNFSLVTAEVALAAATVKTIIQVVAPTNHERVQIDPGVLLTALGVGDVVEPILEGDESVLRDVDVVADSGE